MGMACITKQRVGKYTYLYESTSYRNEDGKPRNRKVRIGKLDPDTGDPVYLESFVQRMTAEGKEPPPVGEGLTQQEAEIARTAIDASKRHGVFHLFHSLARDTGLWKILRDTLPDAFREVFTLACFLVDSQDPLMYCEEWASRNTTLPFLPRMSSQRISELLSGISGHERNHFFEEWIQHVSETGYIAIDITSISSYSKLMDACEWGYNRDHENLPQVNLCMLFGEGSRFPIYQTSYHGSIKDVSTLRSTLDEVAALSPDARLRVVMDKGFYSKRNIDEMLRPSRPVRFLVSVPFASAFAKKLVEGERKGIDCIGNTILTSDGAIRGVHKVRAWKTKDHGSVDLHAHVYFNPVKAAKERNELYAYVTELKREACKDPNCKKLQDEFGKYLIIRKSSRAEGGCTVNVREEVLDEKLKTCGWLVLLSDTVDDAQEALDIYRTKDVVEKNFDRMKNTLDLRRLRVHNDERMENKLFVSFLALALVAALHQRMAKANLYRKYTMHELLLKVGRIHAAEVRGKRILQPISREQQDIFHALGVNPPVG